MSHTAIGGPFDGGESLEVDDDPERAGPYDIDTVVAKKLKDANDELSCSPGHGVKPVCGDRGNEDCSNYGGGKYTHQEQHWGVDGTPISGVYETCCVGYCGKDCSGAIKCTTSLVDGKRICSKPYASLIIHDVCQAFVGSTASIMTGEGMSNGCQDEALSNSVFNSRTA